MRAVPTLASPQPTNRLSIDPYVEPASRRGDVRGIGQGIENGVGGGLGGVNAVGNAYSIEGDTRQEKAGIPRQLAANGLHALGVAEDVLGHGPRMAADLEEQRFARDADQLAQLAGNKLSELAVVEIAKLRLRGSANENAHQGRAGRCAAWELDARERGSQDRPTFNG